MKEKTEERKLCKRRFFHPLCLRLSNTSKLAFERLGTNYDEINKEEIQWHYKKYEQ